MVARLDYPGGGDHWVRGLIEVRVADALAVSPAPVLGPRCGSWRCPRSADSLGVAQPGEEDRVVS